MPKELIVSVNGREKKIAIVENGRVTEFYIERGESSQGIVGNIYKGRVMRVLPGMQSAFVDIGLERDAFLYVSDFFDEEEEYERIVVDKTKTEGADAEAAARAAAERIERSRIERERQMESAQEQAEPLASGAAEAEDEEEAPAPPAAARAPEAGEEEEGGRGRRRRGRGRDREPSGAARAERPERVSAEEVATPFTAGAAPFERVVDEEAAALDGEMFKDARIQERLTDQIRGVEFDLEPTTTAEVGSLLSRGAGGGASFERVDDSDDAGAGGGRQLRSVQPEVAASVARIVDEFEGAEGAGAGARTFERVSDDEGAGEQPAARRRAASKKGAAKKGASKRAADEGGEAGEGAAKKGSKRAASKTASKAAAKKSPAAASKKKAPAKAARGRKSADAGEVTGADAEARREEVNTDADGLRDAEASVKVTPARGEFARRGGRRRRGRTGKPGEEQTNGQNGDAEVVTDVEEAEPEAEVAAAAPPPPQAQEAPQNEQRPAAPQGRGRGRREEGGSRDDGGRREAGGGRREEGGGGRRDDRRREEGRREDGRRDEGRREAGRREEGRREEGRRDDRGGRGGRGRDRGQPAIADLLREGQEIIVQIAKEPIAQKGARITSHIALPGRYLVYMPTVDHVGVSRKIESDQERSRLRKLIQKVVSEEEVPSGGFIVRTAGTGTTEQDLRDDARYLVRTWRDIRRNAEKQKAPSIAHKDLDLVQRILRDQLSEDFTAIRIDNEEEYTDVVEFVNRIQPRLVNRVKLYTREAPILEAYGVEAEIEKAIKPRVWLKSGGYLVINQTEALVAIDVNTGKFVGRGGTRLEDTITRTNLEAVDEIARQIRLRDLGGIIVLDLIDMEERRNRARVMQALQDALRQDKSPTKVLSFNDFGLVIMTRKRVKQSLERTLCSPCPYCQGAGLVKSPQTVCYEILEEARRLSRGMDGDGVKQTTLRLNTEVARALRTTERDVLREIEDYLGAVDVTAEEHLHQEQFDFAFI